MLGGVFNHSGACYNVYEEKKDCELVSIFCTTELNYFRKII